MKRLLLIFALILLAPPLVFAQPFLTCDPQAIAEVYKVTWDTTGVESMSSAQPDGSCHHDLAGVPDGDNAGKIQAGREYTLDGVGQGVYEWGPDKTFLYGNPVDTTASTGLGLGE